MDKQTADYRTAQLRKLVNDWDYNCTLKIHGSKEGNTNCLDISKEEFFAIAKLLTNGQF